MSKSYVLYAYTQTHIRATLGPGERKRQCLNFRQPAGGSILQALLGRTALPRVQKIHLHMSCLTIIIIQKGLLFIWLPSYTQSWCISQGLSDLASPQLCTTKHTTSSRLIPAPSVGIIRWRRSPHSTLISFSTRSPCRIN